MGGGCRDQRLLAVRGPRGQTPGQSDPTPWRTLPQTKDARNPPDMPRACLRMASAAKPWAQQCGSPRFSGLLRTLAGQVIGKQPDPSIALSAQPRPTGCAMTACPLTLKVATPLTMSVPHHLGIHTWGPCSCHLPFHTPLACNSCSKASAYACAVIQ